MIVGVLKKCSIKYKEAETCEDGKSRNCTLVQGSTCECQLAVTLPTHIILDQMMNILILQSLTITREVLHMSAITFTFKTSASFDVEYVDTRSFQHKLQITPIFLNQCKNKDVDNAVRFLKRWKPFSMWCYKTFCVDHLTGFAKNYKNCSNQNDNLWFGLDNNKVLGYTSIVSKYRHFIL